MVHISTGSHQKQTVKIASHIRCRGNAEMGWWFLFSPFVSFYLISPSGHQSLVEWLNETLPYLKLPWEASEDELRACLRDGTVLCSLLNQLSPGSMRMVLMNFDDHLGHISFFIIVLC